MKNQLNVQPLQSILKEPKYTKSITFRRIFEQISSGPERPMNTSTPSQQDLPKIPTGKAQENLLQVPPPVWSYAFQHPSPSRTYQGILPQNIITKEYPKCPSCLYGKSTRHALGAPKPLGWKDSTTVRLEPINPMLFGC